MSHEQQWPLFAIAFESCHRVTATRSRLKYLRMDALRGQEYEAFDRSIDVHVSKLRAKLEKDPRAPRYIKTVRGVGYALVRPGPAR